MRRFLIIGLCVGFGVIVALSGYVIVCVDGMKDKIEATINQGLDQYNTSLKRIGMKIAFDPFECGGILSIQCKSKKIEIFDSTIPNDETLLASFLNPKFAVKEFDLKELKLEYTSGFDYAQKGDLKDYFEILMPKKIRVEMKFFADTDEDFLLKMHYELIAQNLTYDLSLDQRIKSEIFKKQGLLGSIQSPKVGDQVRFEALANDLNSAFFEVVKKQYGDSLSYSDYQGIVAFMAGLSSNMGISDDIVLGITDLILGKKQRLVANLKIRKEICLTCENEVLGKLLKQISVDIETF